ncbi:MAG: T9SS type A sorting domain-containing protein [Bacteroidetes bacterium]|nr:T9SS type A sorting domain-containing protein [Bacteroidota bacterium]
MKSIFIKRSTLLLLFLVFFSFAEISYTQNNPNWITPNRTYLKMYVINDGMSRINKNDFQNAGINTSGIDPRTVKVFNKGIQIPIFFSGEQDGVFNDNDFFDFYGTRNYGGIVNTYDANNNVVYTTNEFYNQYSDTNVYWVDWGGATGIRFQNSSYSVSGLFPDNYFIDKIHFEKDLIYAQGENAAANDYRFLSTEKFLGEGWYWKAMYNTQIQTDTFSAPVQTGSSQNSTFKIFAYPQTQNTSVNNEHSLEIRINGILISTLFSDNLNRIDTTVSFSTSLLSGTSVNTVSITYNHQPGFTGIMYLDNYEISYPRKFIFGNKILSSDLTPSDTTSKLFKVNGFNGSLPVYIYDVRNNQRIISSSSNADTLKLTAKGNGKLFVINDSVRNKPFRIKQKQVPDFVSSSNGADYLIIYNSLFTSQAEQLRSFRSSFNGFRSYKADVEDIYDVFGYGIEDPLSVRYFTNYIYQIWQLPKLKSICLFGRGSLDPKKNSSGSVYYKNLVPVYGNPNSDGYFANFNFGTFYYYPQIAVGRLPAYSTSEAQIMVDKIIAYENLPYDNWNKKYTFITNGSTLAEQASHQQKSNFDCNVYINSPPVSGECTKIYRNDTSGMVTYNYADSIKKAFNEGSVYVNYRGHAGSHNWEVMMEDPNVLSNGNLLPWVVSLTCFTGESAKSEFRAFGEKFLYLPNKGAIGFVGTTGWSYSTNGNDFGSYMLQTLKIDTTRFIGDFVKFAGKSMSRDSLSFSIRHTVNCYNLTGDPAVTLKYPKTPDFKITNSDYKLEPTALSLNTPATLTINPINLGIYAANCRIRFQLIKNNVNHSFKDTVVSAFAVRKEIAYNFRIDTLGIYSMKVILDADNQFPLENENDNVIRIDIPLKESSFIPVRPADNSVQFKDSVEFVILNPNFDYFQSNVRILAEMDTSLNFNSPVKKTFTNFNIKGGTTIFKTSIPVLNNNTLYYWRARSIIDSDTSAWSEYQNFIYNDGELLESRKMRFINESLPVVISKSQKDQFDVSEMNNTYFDNGLKLKSEDAVLFVRSYGSNAEEASYFSVGNNNIYIENGQNTGLNFLKVAKINGTILEFKNLKMNSGTSSDSLVNFLNTFDTTQYLMLLNAAYFPGGQTLSAAAKTRLRQFGSVYCDSIGLLSYFHSWAFIGYLGAGPSQASEMFDPCCRPALNCINCDHWSEAVTTMNVRFMKTSGTVTNVIGPASAWYDFSWVNQLQPNSSLKFDIIGIDRGGNETVLRQDLTSNEFNELATINADQYPELKLIAKLEIDSVTGNVSPVLNSIKVNYSAASELILDKNSIQSGVSSKNASAVNFSFDYTNGGYRYIFGTVVNLYLKSIADSNLISSDTVTQILKTDSTLTYANSFTNPGLRDSSVAWIEIKPKNGQNEFYTFNNSAFIPLNLFTRNTKDEIEITADGKRINSGEKVRQNPDIRITLSGQREISVLQDTSLLSVDLNGIHIPYFNKGNLNQVITPADYDNQNITGNNTVLLKPDLNPGPNRLLLRYKNSAGITDSLSLDLIVSNETELTGIYNYPNPMRNETSFIYELNSPELISGVRLKIYTVQGRMIKEINVQPESGLNRILWDGKDNDGDYVANGTYLYKLFLNDNNKTESGVQKLVILR